MKRSGERDVGRSLQRSHDLKERAMESIPTGTQTYTKGAMHWVQGVSPAFLERGKGCRVWDADGNEYIDYLMACGPVILGHDYEPITDAAIQRLRKGPVMSMPNQLEVDVSELILEVVPCAEQVRFGKNGNDVTTAAARLARAHTQRDVIASYGYHGWTDVWEAAEGGNGVPDAIEELTVPFEYGDVESVERIFENHPDDVAAIVTTPVEHERPKGFLSELRRIADREDALLIFDEVITGFRLAPGGASEFFDVTPDLACFAKGIANGFPVAALAGRQDIMRGLEDIPFSLTYGGETVSLAAAKATIDAILEEDVTDHLFERGTQLKNGFNEHAATHALDGRVECVGLAPFLNTEFTTPDGEPDPMAESLFMQECHRRGILYSGLHFPTYSHTSDVIAETLSVYDEAMEELSVAVAADDVEQRLDGEPIGSPLQS